MDDIICLSQIKTYSSPEDEAAEIIRMCNDSKDCLYCLPSSFLDHDSKVLILRALTMARNFISDLTGIDACLEMEVNNESV